ncbi:VPA1269 family protein (plasmid) [Photobacterium sp. DA100]|uniref:gamma-mobile-trio integrase GmtZ n=1 Tax=Photobacterium sp. DA100 TaxID=3027472 RepID=UPI00247A12D9|nr:VPA1269 family protein [Photobacterium sp. DA100]WEM45478.1 VPA1269 family protein [Photobacterium sp. DA100]
MARKLTFDGRSTDDTFMWLVNSHGKEWHQWAEFAASWLATLTATAHQRNALTHFFETYLVSHVPYAAEPTLFFSGKDGHISSSEEFIKILVDKGANTRKGNHNNIIVDFIDWVIKHHFSIDDEGQPTAMFVNPLEKVKSPSGKPETVRTPLPYRYIIDLLNIIHQELGESELEQRKKVARDKATEQLNKLQQKLERLQAKLSSATTNQLKETLTKQVADSEHAITLKKAEILSIDTLPSYRFTHFSDWKWASEIEFGRNMWIEVDIDYVKTHESDPDFKWRRKTVRRNNKGVLVYQHWSPVCAMLAFIKLHLPLRTYQIRMLDSGEADTHRYEGGAWLPNKKHDFKLGTARNPFSKGVFTRLYDSYESTYSTGLYINSNKTADQNKDELDRGYTIPWQNEEVLYWLEKLRNWQEKYNPISKPTSCLGLKKKHTDEKKTKAQLSAMGDICFLFRDASAKGSDKQKPISKQAFATFWYQLLLELEDQLEAKSITLKDGKKLKLVRDYPEGTSVSVMFSTLFPPHSIRVSLITAYTMETDLPLPVISKLLAGHTRLLMTIYYNKITPSVMRDLMDGAQTNLLENAGEQTRLFLRNQSLEQIECKMVYHDNEGTLSALTEQLPVGWSNRPCGLCLVGGNTTRMDTKAPPSGCWNGGVLLVDNTQNGNARLYESLPPHSCTRCRWLVTNALYLPALIAHNNRLSYQVHDAANLAVELEGELRGLMDEFTDALENDAVFTKHAEMELMENRVEQQNALANELAKDYIGTFKLIQRIVDIENQRQDGDTSDKLVALGDQDDVEIALQFMETDSELFHLSLLSHDAEVYPALMDDLVKLPALPRQAKTLSRFLVKKGYEPVFLEMDDKTSAMAANALMREMAKIADPDNLLEGMRKAATYLESGQYLEENGLLEKGVAGLIKSSDTIQSKLLKDLIGVR